MRKGFPLVSRRASCADTDLYFRVVAGHAEQAEESGNAEAARTFCVMLAGAVSMARCLNLCSKDIIRYWENYALSRCSDLEKAVSDIGGNPL